MKNNNDNKKIQKTLKINQIAIDNMTNIVYNTAMRNKDTNNNNTFTKGTKNMTNMNNDVRVIKHINGAYDVYANFNSVQDALDYMRRMDFTNDSWYIVNADGVRLRMNDQGKLVVFNSLIG